MGAGDRGISTVPSFRGQAEKMWYQQNKRSVCNSPKAGARLVCGAGTASKDRGEWIRYKLWETGRKIISNTLMKPVGEIIREERAEEAARDAVESCSFFL